MSDIRTYEYKLYLGVNIQDPKSGENTLILSKDVQEVEIDQATYNISLNGVKFYRKIYEPGHIEAEVAIVIKEAKDFPTIDQVVDLLLRRQVTLTIKPKGDESVKEEETAIAENYYVFEVLPQLVRNSGKASLFVKLAIYSLDKLMTLDKYSKAYVGKKLGEDILLPETLTFGFDGNVLLQASVGQLQNMKSAQYDEFIQPYLVQYNESFYDFMARTANRCGELFYFEDGQLNLGLKKIEEIPTIEDYQSITLINYSKNPFTVIPYYRDSVKDVDDKGQMKEGDLNFSVVEKDKDGYPTDAFPDSESVCHTYNVEEATDEYINPLTKDKWTDTQREMGIGNGGKNAAKDGAIKVILSIIGNELKNYRTDGFLNFIDFAKNIVTEYGKATAKSIMAVGDTNSDGNDDYITKQKTLHTEEQTDGTKFVGFATLGSEGWITNKLYSKIRQCEIEQQKKAICIDMGVSYQAVKLGQKIKVDKLTDTYIVIQVEMLSGNAWTNNYREYGQEVNDVRAGSPSQIIYAIPVSVKDNVETVYPPVSSMTYREAGPQTAIVLDNKDPKYQGRVRIVYPWQTRKNAKRLALQSASMAKAGAENKVKELKVKLEELRKAKLILATEKEMLDEYASLPEEERENWIKAKEEKIAQDEALIKELTITKRDEMELSREEYIKKVERQPELEAAKKDRDMLQAMLQRLKDSSTLTPKEIVAIIDEEIDAKADEITQTTTDFKNAEKELQSKVEELEVKINEVKLELLQMASPWVRVATPSATTGGGTYFKPQVGDEVLVNYDNNNVERPYVVGSLFSKNVPTPEESNTITAANSGLLKKASTYIVSPNGHHIAFNDPKDGSKLMEGIHGGLTTIIDKMGYQFDDMKDLTGGIHIGDRYGLYELSMSSHDRKIKVRSPYGDVNIDAFTGITINAPNGDIKIKGKNVEISAGNNLVLKSGQNIQKPVYSNPTGLGKLGSFVDMTITGTLNALVDMYVGEMVDMKLIRQVTEVFLRPIEGTLQIKSNRYMKLEAGMGTNAAIPSDRYTQTQKRNEVAVNEIEFMSKMVACIKYINNTMDGFIGQYKTKWDTLATQKTAYTDKMQLFVKAEEAENVPTIVKSVLKKGMDANVDEAWPNNVVTNELFNNKINDGIVIINGTQYEEIAGKQDVLVSDGNLLAWGVYDLHKHMKKVFEHLFDAPFVEGADQKMKDLIKSTFVSRRANIANLWEGQYISGGNVTDDFLRGDMQHISDAFIAASKKFKRAFAAVFITKVAHDPGYQMENLGDGAGNVVSNFIRNPLDSAAKGKFLHVHYKESDVKEDRLGEEFYWHHFLNNMQRPTNVIARRIYDISVGNFKNSLQVDEFAKIHDRKVWADRGRGTILMSDNAGETRAFDSGAFTPDKNATTGSWGALIKALKGIK